jgi:ABC-2 type transport system permease protein
MKTLVADLRLLARSRFSVAALGLLLILTSLAVMAGLSAVARQNATIDRVAAAQQRDLAAVAAEYGKPDGEAGSAAYYTFHLTSDRPSDLAFAALGQRDIQPYVLRVRLLGLQAQLYESEVVNPELALPGPFDFVFVLIYLAPLIVIALMHDLVTGEREAGRMRLLSSLPSRPGGLWLRRASLRYGIGLLALLLPLAVGGVVAGAAPAGIAALGLIAALYLAFWFGLSLLVAARGRTSAGAATALVGCWIVLTLLIPAAANAAITRAIPVARGVDLTLAQREAVHHAWDIPKDEIFRPFFVKRPEWRDTPPVTGRFHWKWYYAMHEMGDDAVAPQLAEYRDALADRQAATSALSWVSPAAAVQTLAHRIADTDLAAHLAWQDGIIAFHDRLKDFYYPYLFEERPFDRPDFAVLPTWQVRSGTGSLPTSPLIALTLLVLVATAAGALASGRRRDI